MPRRDLISVDSFVHEPEVGTEFDSNICAVRAAKEAGFGLSNCQSRALRGLYASGIALAFPLSCLCHRLCTEPVYLAFFGQV